MTPHFDPKNYYLLKKRVLFEANIKDIAPSDCKYLSLSIYNKIGRRISETTLKRIYGFAFAEFKPSMFTINTMAEYCGYESWTAYLKDLISSSDSLINEQKPWHKTLEKADQITRVTLQVLKNKSGIPYERTIKRGFINDHFDAFFREEAVATVLLAPSGYGKTIALCHWIEDFLEVNKSPGLRDIVLFFSGSALINAYENGYNLNNWLLALLGLDPNNFMNDLFLPGSGFEGWFYLIVDGLDEVHYKGYHFANIFEQLNDIIILHNNTYRLKIITTMRSATWCNNEHHIINKQHWFKGFLVDKDESLNVPLMDKQELIRLTQKIDPTVTTTLSETAVKTLNMPIFFQYYLKKNNGVGNIHEFDEVDEFDVISVYVLNKIYRSKHAVNMITFIREFILHLDHQSKIYRVSKLKIQQLIKNYHQAFEELINIGYMENIDSSQDIQLDNYIRFSSSKLMEHSVAKKFYFDNEKKLDAALLNIINNNITDEYSRVKILKWCIYLTVNDNKNIDLSILAGFETSLSRKSDLISFVSKLLQRCDNVGGASVAKFDGNVFDYFIGLEYANVEYEHALHNILNFSKSDTEEIILKCSLGVIAILELNVNKLEKLINDLKQYSTESYDQFVLNPLICLDTVFHYLKYGIVKKEAFIEITKFYFRPPANAYSSEKNSFNEVLFMLAIHTLAICKSPNKTIRFINALKKIYPNGTFAYKFLIEISVADAFMETRNRNMAHQIFNRLSAEFEIGQHGFTQLMKVYFRSLKIKILAADKDKQMLVTQLRNLIKLCDEYSYKLVKIISAAHVLTRLSNDNNAEEDNFDDFYFDMVRTIRVSGCRTESFYIGKSTT